MYIYHKHFFANNIKHLYKQYDNHRNYNTILRKKKEGGLLNQIKEKPIAE